MAADQSDSPIDCPEARVRTRAFAAGELGVAATRELRKHLASCAECMSLYRDTLQTTAQLAQLGAEAREARQLDRRRRAAHAAHFGRKDAPPPKKARNWRLRMILMPAFFIWLMTQIAGFGQPPAKVEVVSHLGAVEISGRPVQEDKQPQLVLPGRWVLTGPFSKAEIDARECLVQLADRTEALVESARPVRFRLRVGRMKVEGDLVIVCVLGLVRIEEGRGRVTLDERGLTIEAESGSWTFFDDGGERRVAPGRELLVPPPFQRAP